MTLDPGAPRPRPSLTPPAFPSPLAQRHLAAGAVIPAAVQSPAALPVPPRAGRTAPVWWFGVLVLVLVILVAYFLSAMGPYASIIGMLLALVPLAGVLVAVRLVDRWEPEPWSL